MELKAYTVSETPFRKCLQIHEYETRNKNEHGLNPVKRGPRRPNFITFVAGVSQESA